jgi:hypothetical protein
MSTSSCAYEDVHCELSFETDAAAGSSYHWDTQECSAEVLGDNFMRLQMQVDGQHIELDIFGPLSPGAHELEIEYVDGSTRWEHDGGHLGGAGPACTVVFDSFRKEEWTKTTRVRASGTIECPGKLTNIDDEELAFFNASFDVFASDDSLLIF